MMTESYGPRAMVGSRAVLPLAPSVFGELALAAALLLLWTPCLGMILNVPSQYPTIQAAITAAAQQGDEVVVADGTYTGPGNAGIYLEGKEVTVRSQSGIPSTCTIDGQFTRGAVVCFQQGEDSRCVLEGFTITGGADVGINNGGGIYVQGASPTIRNCIITDNQGGDPSGYPGHGGGINIWGASSPDISDCVITLNWAAWYHGQPSYGGGVYSESHTAVLRNCTLTDNRAGYGGGFFGNGTFIDCTIRDNVAESADSYGGVGGGINAQAASLLGCVIAGNEAGLSGGGLGGSATVEGCTIAGNRCGGNQDFGGGGGGLAIDAGSSLTLTIVCGNCSSYRGDDILAGGNPVLICCCVDPSKIDGMVTFDGPQINQDPLFCDPEPCASAPTLGGDYRLQDTSPCLPSAHPCGSNSLVGALSQGCSGPVPTEQTTWGRLKARFR